MAKPCAATGCPNLVAEDRDPPYELCWDCRNEEEAAREAEEAFHEEHSIPPGGFF